MRLADDIRIRIGGGDVVLRPSLRNAIRLERRPGGFKRLMAEVLDGSLTAACEIIEPFHDSPFLMWRVFDAGVHELAEPLTRYVIACAGIDADAAQDAPNGKAVTFAEHLQSLYRIGTGWLGWTPDTTLDSTPHEIMEAHKGRIELLQAVFGSAEAQAPKPSDADLTAKFRSLFNTIGTTKVERKAA